eukprot:TRINITY_DN12156_c0_g1_i1.p1 TRINITY_DN12156_c0_g1~~TRINITY_DN12156_c0_g1_i1.p1  ORF type:complete len:186 (+),score=36.77 TRINITY_DN12156_c0_g1_i1:207-764(+)
MRWFTPLLLAVLFGQAGAIGGFHHWKVGTMFEGLLESLGVKIRADAFSGGFEVERCDLAYSRIHDNMHHSFHAFEFGNSSQVKKGLLRLASGVQLFAASLTSCDLGHLAAKLQEAAEDISVVVSDEVWASSAEGGLAHVTVSGHNLTQVVLDATRAWYGKRYSDCGKEIARLAVRVRLKCVEWSR